MVIRLILAIILTLIFPWLFFVWIAVVFLKVLKFI